MKRQTMLAVGTGVSILAAVTWTTTSFAQEVVVAEPAPRPVVAEQTHYAPPNRALLGGGLIAFGGSYIPSVIVAAANNNPYDNHLYIPVVGPWLDLGNRPACGGVFQTGCGTETGFRTLLVVDGIFQGAGATLDAPWPGGARAAQHRLDGEGRPAERPRPSGAGEPGRVWRSGLRKLLSGPSRRARLVAGRRARREGVSGLLPGVIQDLTVATSSFAVVRGPDEQIVRDHSAYARAPRFAAACSAGVLVTPRSRAVCRMRLRCSASNSMPVRSLCAAGSHFTTSSIVE